MTTPLTAHPSLADLKAFGLGKLAPGSAETVLQHVETCLECQRAVAESSGDSFLGRLRAAAQPGDGTKPPAKSLSGVARSLTQRAPANQVPVESAGPLPPELVGNAEFEIVRELGRGGMGVVYLARNTLMGRDEVLKVMGRDVMGRPGAVDRFKREIQSAARLDHSNIVRAYSARQMGELLVFTMEYVPGEELGALVKARGRLPVVNACYYIQQVANGLQHAYTKGMVHRDIKPANLIRVVQGKKHTVKILDFGLAKLTSVTGGEADLTGTGQMMGTPHYMAPEQANDATRADIRADIYSLGCTLYFLLTGGPPFPVNNIFELLLKHREEMPLAVNYVRPQIPMELADVVAKMMAKNVEERYQTPAEVAKALTPFIPKAGSSAGAHAPAAAVDPPIVFHKDELIIINPDDARVPDAKVASPVPVVLLRPPLFASPGGRSPNAWETILPEVTAGERPLVPACIPEKRRLIWPWLLVAVGTMFAVLVAAWAGGVLKVRTPQGVVIIENVPTDAQVEIDGERVTITRDGEVVTVTAVKGGRHRFKVVRNGQEVWVSDVTLSIGKEPVRIRADGPTLAPMAPPPKSTLIVPSSNNEVAGKFAIPAKAQNNWVPLFNGKDLTGWNTEPQWKDKWQIENDTLSWKLGYFSYLCTERTDYTDFHFRMATRVGTRGYSQLVFRDTFSEIEKAHKGYTIAINSDNENDMKTGSLAIVGGSGVRGWVVRNPNSPVPAEQWFLLEVIAKGGHLVIKVDGRIVTDYLDNNESFTRGRITLWPGHTIQYRKIEIKELP